MLYRVRTFFESQPGCWQTVLVVCKPVQEAEDREMVGRIYYVTLIGYGTYQCAGSEPNAHLCT